MMAGPCAMQPLARRTTRTDCGRRDLRSLDCGAEEFRVLWALQRERGIGGGANGTLPRPQGVASVWASERTVGNDAGGRLELRTSQWRQSAVHARVGTCSEKKVRPPTPHPHSAVVFSFFNPDPFLTLASRGPAHPQGKLSGYPLRGPIGFRGLAGALLQETSRERACASTGLA